MFYEYHQHRPVNNRLLPWGHQPGQNTYHVRRDSEIIDWMLRRMIQQDTRPFVLDENGKMTILQRTVRSCSRNMYLEEKLGENIFIYIYVTMAPDLIGLHLFDQRPSQRESICR